MGLSRSKRCLVPGAIGVLTVGMLGAAILVAPGVANAVNNNPVSNPTRPAISYEADCVSILGQVTPFVTTIDGNTSVDDAAATGTTFGFSGTATTVIGGAFVANLYADSLGSNPLSLQWTEMIGSSDRHATGSYTFNTPTTTAADGGGETPPNDTSDGTHPFVTWAKASTTLSGNFSAAKVGDTVASTQVGLAPTATITKITGTTSATIDVPTNAAAVKANHALVGWGTRTTFTDSKLNTGNVFTTEGSSGQTAGVGVVSVSQFTAAGLPFGGSPGQGASNCVLTGYDAGGNPGPGQSGGSPPTTGPVLPMGSTTALVSLSPLRFPPGAYVNLLSVPGAPTRVTATAGDASARVSWTAPADGGGVPIQSYRVTSIPDGMTCTTSGATDCTVTGLTNATPYTFTVTATNRVGTGPASAPSNPVTPVAPGGYWVVTAHGDVFSHGPATAHGSAGSIVLDHPIVGSAAAPDGKGYWLVASDGGVFAYGSAGFYGSMGGRHLNAPIVGMAAAPSGKGYWLVAADGGVFAFGDAAFAGSAAGRPLDAPVVGVAGDGSKGYWLVASDGGVFAYGNAGFLGSMGGVHLDAPVTGLASVADGHGYWLIGSDGGVFSFGTAAFHGSAVGFTSGHPVVGIAASSNGYVMASSDGGVFAFDAPFYGSQAGRHLNAPVVSIST